MLEWDAPVLLGRAALGNGAAASEQSCPGSIVESQIDELSADDTIVIVTHDMQQASRASDYRAFMYLGELVEYGATEKIFTAPENKKTEQYITGRFS